MKVRLLSMNSTRVCSFPSLGQAFILPEPATVTLPEIIAIT
jgi:hypothetical protein